MLSVAQIGNALRVLVAVDEEAIGDRLQRALQTQGIDAEVTRIAPNLEDVFVMATHRKPQAEAA